MPRRDGFQTARTNQPTAATLRSMQIFDRPEPSDDWDDFVRSRRDASIYLLSGWSRVLRDALRFKVHYFEARSQEYKLVGVLPLAVQRSFLGVFATSVPCFNYGGALCASDSHIRVHLMERARALADAEGCAYVEFRDRIACDGPWSPRLDKVCMLLDLPGDAQLLSQQLGAKLRSQIRRADREGPVVQRGGHELLNDFYSVFSANMRDLGTPVYPRAFFEFILRAFPELCTLVVVRSPRGPAAAGFLVSHGGCTEVPWAACRAEAKSLGYNMRLYWELMDAAIARGSSTFDFGRSTVGSGTYRFKEQWGARPQQLYWHRWERAPSVRSSGAGRIMRMASSVWKRLPLPVANALGPLVSPALPW